MPTVAPTADPREALPDDVPVLDNAFELVVTQDGTYISYQAETTVAEATAFYQEQLVAQGWEQKNRKDSGFGDSITMLRSKPEQNISVTLQAAAGSNTIRVLITLIPK